MGMETNLEWMVENFHRRYLPVNFSFSEYCGIVYAPVLFNNLNAHR